MHTLNRFEIIGNLTADPEISETRNGKPMARVRLAQNRVHKDANGNKTEKALYLSLNAFGPSAEVIGKYARKGGKMYFDCQAEPWSRENESGTREYGISFTVRNFQFLDAKPERPEDASRTEPFDDERDLEAWDKPNPNARNRYGKTTN